ncbi:hypothetical protein Hanom_Chr04g00335961 [Helianthus anomalus]
MSAGEHQEDSSEEMFAGLPSMKWSRETFDDLVRSFKFPDSWGVRYPEDGQTTTDASAGYITLFWDYFAEGNFRLPATRFFLDILAYYKLHISQLHPIRMGFHSFAQRASAKKILLHSPKLFHEWKPKFFFIKAGVIPMKMTFRGKEDIVTETIQTPYSETWY